jgi:hypothetical protein
MLTAVLHPLRYLWVGVTYVPPQCVCIVLGKNPCPYIRGSYYCALCSSRTAFASGPLTPLLPAVAGMSCLGFVLYIWRSAVLLDSDLMRTALWQFLRSSDPLFRVNVRLWRSSSLPVEPEVYLAMPESRPLFQVPMLPAIDYFTAANLLLCRTPDLEPNLQAHMKLCRLELLVFSIVFY